MIARPRFSRQELLFSLKSFAAAMLALYLSSRFALPRPFWAMMTAYIVAHPLASNVRSKALYRFLGTLLGCAATVVLVPSLSGSPELLSLALALWVGLCLYLSLLDRSARSYVFMLAGYSAALIGFPLVEAPAAMFDTAVARVTEIGLGILCASWVHSLVLPNGLGPSLLGVMDRALGDARQWLTDLLRETPAKGLDPRIPADRQRLALDITQLRLLSTHVPFDTGLRWSGGAIDALRYRVTALTPVLSAVEDCLQALCTATGGVPDDIGSTFAQHSGWLDPRATSAGVDDACAAFRAIADGPAASPWILALRIDLATLGCLHHAAQRYRCRHCRKPGAPAAHPGPGSRGAPPGQRARAALGDHCGVGHLSIVCPVDRDGLAFGIRHGDERRRLLQLLRHHGRSGACDAQVHHGAVVVLARVGLLCPGCHALGT